MTPEQRVAEATNAACSAHETGVTVGDVVECDPCGERFAHWARWLAHREATRAAAALDAVRAALASDDPAVVRAMAERVGHYCGCAWCCTGTPREQRGQATPDAIHHHPRERTTRMTTPTNPPAGDMTAPSEGRRTRLGEVIYGAMFEVQIDLRYGGAEKAEYIADAVRRALEEAEPGDHPDSEGDNVLRTAMRWVETA